MRARLPPLACLALVLPTANAWAAAPSQPQLDWSLFPEGTTTRSESRTSNKNPGTWKATTYTITRKGSSVEVAIASCSGPLARAPERPLRRFVAQSLSTPAQEVGGDDSLALVCVKDKVGVPMTSVTQYCDVPPPKRPKPSQVAALQCDLVVGAEKGSLLFVPGRAVVSRVQANDCDMGYSLTFASDAELSCPAQAAAPPASSSPEGPGLRDPLPDPNALEGKCRALAEKFVEARAGATGRCAKASDCGCFLSVSFDGILFETDADTARKLDAASRAYHAASCPTIHVDTVFVPKCEPRCVDGRCQKAPPP